MTKGLSFSIELILSDQKFGNSAKTEPKRSGGSAPLGQKITRPGQNYKNNITLSHTSYHSYDMGLDTHKYHGGFKTGFGAPILGLPTKPSLIADKPMMISTNNRPKEGFRPGSLGSSWPHSTPHSREVPVHKMGQVQGTRKPKPRKTQTVFTTQQLTALEHKYANKQYITTEERIQIADALQMSIPQVKNWFQNKRNKEKKLGNPPTRNHANIGAPHCDYLNRSSYSGMTRAFSKYY